MKCALAIVFLLVLDCFGQGKVDPAKWAGCVGYWTANGTARDASFFANNGVEVGSFPYVAGWLGAFNFNGSSQSVRLPYNASLAFGAADFTIVAWIKLVDYSANPTFQFIVSSDKQIGSRNYSLYMNSPDGSLRFTDHKATVTYFTDAFTLPTNTWKHVAATRSGTTLTLYIDGAAKTNGTCSSSFDAAIDTYIGQREFSGFPEWFKGNIDEVGLFTRALSTSEINQLVAGRHP